MLATIKKKFKIEQSAEWDLYIHNYCEQSYSIKENIADEIIIASVENKNQSERKGDRCRPPFLWQIGLSPGYQ